MPKAKSWGQSLCEFTWAGVDLRRLFARENISYLACVATVVCSCNDSTMSPLRDPRGIILLSDARAHSQIYAVTPDGNEIRQLTHNDVMNTDPALSPDGTKIVFISAVDSIPGFPGRRPDVYLMNATGSGVKRLFPSPNTSWHPRWSPDGQKIVFASVDPATGDFRPYVMNADGSNVHVIGNAPGGSFDLEWSPDGTHFLFSSNRSPRSWWTMYVMNVDGTGEHELAGDNACVTNASSARWSPDGARILYSCDRDGGLYVIGADGTNPVRIDTALPANGSLDGSPVWSPGGDMVAFTSNRESDLGTLRWHAYTVAAVGGTPLKITTGDIGWVVRDWAMVR